MSCTRRTVITDEYSRVEKKDETLVRYAAPRYIPLRRAPSLSSVVTTVNTMSRPKSCLGSRDSGEQVIAVRVDTKEEDLVDQPATRISRLSKFNDQSENRVRKTSMTYKSNENLNDLSVDFKETIETSRPATPPPPCVRQSQTNLHTITSDSRGQDPFEPIVQRPRLRRSISSRARKNENEVVVAASEEAATKSTLTYVFNSNDDKRQVTYIRQADNNSGLSLPGCLVKASETFLPVTRSVNLGAIFNGNSFGLLSESIQIRDSFELSFDFRTTCTNGILAILVDKNSQDSFFIELYDSQIKSTLFIDGEADSCWTDFTPCFLSNDIWASVNVTLRNNRMTLLVKNNYFTKKHRHELRYPIRGDLFVAGHPSSICPPFVCRSRDFFIGEMRNFNVNNNGVKWYGTPSNVSVRLRNWY